MRFPPLNMWTILVAALFIVAVEVCFQSLDARATEPAEAQRQLREMLKDYDQQAPNMAHDHGAAAQGLIKELQKKNDALEREVAVLKAKLAECEDDG